jgi:hypothetical protein
MEEVGREVETYIQEVCGSNSGGDTRYPEVLLEVPHYAQKSSGILPQLGHDRFLRIFS